jgi:hypothetical protein
MRPYCTVCVLLMLILLLASLLFLASTRYAIAGLPSAVDVCDVHIVPADAVDSGLNSVPEVVGRL